MYINIIAVNETDSTAMGGKVTTWSWNPPLTFRRCFPLSSLEELYLLVFAQLETPQTRKCCHFLRISTRRAVCKKCSLRRVKNSCRKRTIRLRLQDVLRNNDLYKSGRDRFHLGPCYHGDARTSGVSTRAARTIRTLPALGRIKRNLANVRTF